MREKLVADFRFVILNPGHGRAAFKIDRRPGGRVSNPDLDAINREYRAGKLDFQAARKQVEELRYRLYKEARAIRAVTHNTDNERLVERYWKSEYAHRTLQDPKTARSELDRSVAALGMLSIHAASREELQGAVDRFRGNKQRRIVSALQRLLTFAGRDIKLRREKKEKRRVKSLSEREFKLVLEKVPLESLENLIAVAFYTGARIGECFAMEADDFDEDKLELKIRGQIDKKGLSRDTKNRRDRVTLVFPSGVKYLKKWLALKGSFELSDRPHMAEIVSAACEKAFPGAANKKLTFHDLRHCYARLCREKGLSTEDVADLIGDSLVVAKEHYSGFGASDAIMTIRRKAIQRPSKL